MKTEFMAVKGFEVNLTKSIDGQRTVLFQVDLRLDNWHITLHHQTAGERTWATIHATPDGMRSVNYVTYEYIYLGTQGHSEIEVRVCSRNSPGLIDEGYQFPVLWVDGAYSGYSNAPTRPIKQSLEAFVQYSNALMVALSNWAVQKVLTRKDGPPAVDCRKHDNLDSRAYLENTLFTASPLIAKDFLLGLGREAVFDSAIFFDSCIKEGAALANRKLDDFLSNVTPETKIFIDVTPLSQCLQEESDFYQYIKKNIDLLRTRYRYVEELLNSIFALQRQVSFICLDVGFALVPMQKEHREFYRISGNVLSSVSKRAMSSFHLLTLCSGVRSFPLNVFSLCD